MKPESVAIFHSNDPMPRNGDQFFPYVQQSDMIYLSGVAQPKTILLLYPDAPRAEMKEILFVEKGNDHSTIWEGSKLSKKQVREISGIQKVFWLEQWQQVLTSVLVDVRRIYIHENEGSAYQTDVVSRNMRCARELRDKFPFHKYHRSQPILRKLRMNKSEEEIKLIRHACQITDQAFRSVLRNIKAGMREYEVESHIIQAFIARGSSGHAYEPIVASGASACVLHYIQNDGTCEDGDLVLLDFGAQYAHYASDLSRTIPVNGRFSPRQREVYSAVLDILYRTREMMVPGITMEELNREVGAMMNHALVELGLLNKKDISGESGTSTAYRKYFMHGVAHHLGLDVHDLSNRNTPLQAGMVLTCEPGIYIPEEKLGIRIENNILVTDEEPVDLMADIPIEIEEIESLMQVGVLN